MARVKEKNPLIVLIEDDEVMANLLKSKLEKAGLQVLLANDGLTGLDLIKAHKPDLVLLDLLLPKLNGFGVLERLKAEGELADLPVIVISNSGQPVELERVRRFGVRDYLIKVNFNPDEVLAKVQTVLAAPAEPANGVHPQSPPRTARVLLVEDDVFLAGLLEAKFHQRGYTVYKAPAVDEARRVLADEPVDVILLDIVLPGMHGLAFLEELKAHETYRAIPVVIISNLGQQDEVQKGLAAGAVDYIVKANATPGEILEKVESILKK